MILPMVSSWLALQVPTWAISFEPLMGLDMDFSSSTMDAMALSMPCFTWLAFAPAVMFFRPSLKMDSA